MATLHCKFRILFIVFQIHHDDLISQLWLWKWSKSFPQLNYAWWCNQFISKLEIHNSTLTLVSRSSTSQAIGYCPWNCVQPRRFPRRACSSFWRHLQPRTGCKLKGRVLQVSWSCYCCHYLGRISRRICSPNIWCWCSYQRHWNSHIQGCFIPRWIDLPCFCCPNGMLASFDTELKIMTYIGRSLYLESWLRTDHLTHLPSELLDAFSRQWVSVCSSHTGEHAPTHSTKCFDYIPSAKVSVRIGACRSWALLYFSPM